jgi:hypothetical protein
LRQLERRLARDLRLGDLLFQIREFGEQVDAAADRLATQRLVERRAGSRSS